MDDAPSKALTVAGGKLDIFELARRAGIASVPAPIGELEAHSLRLGKLSPLPGFEEGFFGAYVEGKVAIYRQLARKRGEEARAPVGFQGYLRARKERYSGLSDVDTFTADFVGYLRYLYAQAPDLGRVLDAELNRPRFITERDRQAHTLVTGASRSGKSELLKLILHHYARHPELGGVLVVDPHGSMAMQIPKWSEFAGQGKTRLVYLDATAARDMRGQVPALNPIVKGSASPSEVATIAGQLAEALAYFGGDGEGLTPQMRRLGAFALQVMLDIPGSTLVDLRRWLRVPKSDRNALKPNPSPLVNVGLVHPDEMVREFFADDFDGESYRSTRDALSRRLSNYLREPLFRQMVTAPTPVNLEELLNAGKFVVVNCASAGTAGFALGQFIVAQVASMSVRRMARPHDEMPPVHVLVDEATELMAPTFIKLLERAAKTKIWLTMAQHGAGEGGDRQLVARVKRSTYLKLIGRSGNTKELLDLLGVSRSELPAMQLGDFIVSRTGEERMPMLLRAPSHLANGENDMSPAEFAEMLEHQFAAYYRPMAALPPPAPAVAALDDDWADE